MCEMKVAFQKFDLAIAIMRSKAVAVVLSVLHLMGKKLRKISDERALLCHIPNLKLFEFLIR